MFRSGDEGVTWTEQTRNSIMPLSEDTPHGVSLILSHETTDHHVTVYLLGSSDSGRLWISTDGGLTYALKDSLPRGVFALYPSPMYSMKLLARRASESPSLHEVWLSTDGATTWSRVLHDVPAHAPVTWSTFVDTPPDRIYATRNSPIGKGYGAQLVYSDDMFKTQHAVTLTPYDAHEPSANASSSVLYWWLMPPHKMLLVTCVDHIACAQRELYLSANDGKSWTRAVFPRAQRDASVAADFRVYELNEAALWVEVPRPCKPGSDGCDSDLFHSNAFNQNFTLALERTLPWEFTKYYGVDGIYIANQYVDAQHTAVRSLITYNKGSQWQPLRAPLLDAQGQPTQCIPERGCSLHVRGYTAADPFTWFYSIPNAPGIMIANGNLGRGRDVHVDQASVYYSRNGGVNWTQVAQGPHVPEIGDHGAVVVLVPTAEGTALRYSVNDGVEWPRCTFTSAPMFVRNVRVSQGWDSRRFVMYGRRRTATGEETVVFHLNFDAAFTQNACSEQRGDYEQWSPVDEHGQCVLGKHTVVKRRRAGVACYLPEEHVPETMEGACPCDADDYECEHCFYRPSLQAPCTLECLLPGLPQEPRAVCEKHEYWETELGYRLVEGNMCDPSLPGSVKPKARVPCGFPRPDEPATAGGSGHTNVGALVGILIALLVIALVGAVLYLWRYNDSFYNAVSYSTGIDNCFGRGGTIDVAVYDQVLQGAGGSLLDTDDKEDKPVQVSLDDE